jgi:trigger factor
MSEVGERNNIQVTEEEVQRALSAQMRQFPGQEQALIEYYRKNPEAVGALRAPIFEQKVTDFVLELANVTETPVSREELLRDDDADRIV